MGNVSKITLDGFEWVENLSKLNEGFITEYGENSNTGYFFGVDIEYPKTFI